MDEIPYMSGFLTVAMPVKSYSELVLLNRIFGYEDG